LGNQHLSGKTAARGGQMAEAGDDDFPLPWPPILHCHERFLLARKEPIAD
jgi:hypothetical protein